MFKIYLIIFLLYTYALYHYIPKCGVPDMYLIRYFKTHVHTFHHSIPKSIDQCKAKNQVVELVITSCKQNNSSQIFRNVRNALVFSDFTNGSFKCLKIIECWYKVVTATISLNSEGDILVAFKTRTAC